MDWCYDECSCDLIFLVVDKGIKGDHHSVRPVMRGQFGAVSHFTAPVSDVDPQAAVFKIVAVNDVIITEDSEPGCESGRASCSGREGVFDYVPLVAVSLKK